MESGGTRHMVYRNGIVLNAVMPVRLCCIQLMVSGLDEFVECNRLLEEHGPATDCKCYGFALWLENSLRDRTTYPFGHIPGVFKARSR